MLKLKVKKVSKGTTPPPGVLFECRYHTREEAESTIPSYTGYDSAEAYEEEYSRETQDLMGDGTAPRDYWVLAVDYDPELNEFGVISP